MAGDLIAPGYRVFPRLPPARGSQHGLGRQARQVRRLAPDQSRLNQGDRAAGVRQAGGDEHSRCSPAKYYDIELRHLVTPPSDGSDSLNDDSQTGAGDGVRHG